MQNKKRILGLSMILCAIACAPRPVEYGPAIKNGTGYSDRKIGSKNYEIQVFGNTDSTVKELEPIFDRRATELCGSARYSKNIKSDQFTHIKDGMLIGAGGVPVFVPQTINKYNFISGSVTCK